MPEPRVVLVTGASSGFGKEGATLLAQNGFRVFGASRKPFSKDIGMGVEMLQLDVDSDDSVINCVRTVVDQTGRLDVLVNNAGYLMVGGVEETSVGEAKAQFETNFFGAVRMVKAVLPVMRKQGYGQIINVSSLAATISIPFQAYYAGTKAALLSFSEALRYEVKDFGIRVSVVEPGFFRTELGRNTRTAKGLIADYDQLRVKTTNFLDDGFQKGGDPKVVARSILGIVESKSPRLEYFAGKVGRYRAMKHILPQSMFEGVVRRRLKLEA